jgi:hypothetical protein
MAMRSGEIKAADLARGLFMFDCTRSQVFSPGSEGEVVDPALSKHAAQLRQLLPALEAAEADNRLRWGDGKVGREAYALVDEVLTANGFTPLERPQQASSMDNLYTHRSVRQRSSELSVV